MEPSPYVTDFERQKQLLFDRYMRLRRNYIYDSSNERYQWVEAARKVIFALFIIVPFKIPIMAIDTLFCYESRSQIDTWDKSKGSPKLYARSSVACLIKRSNIPHSGNVFVMENQYHPVVRVNNWSEEQWDVDFLKQRRPLNSDYDYAYKTEYLSRYGDTIGEKIPGRNHKCFPGHQPELDLPPLKRVYDSFETTSRVAYQHPGIVTTRQNETPCIYCRLHAAHVRN